MLCQTPALCDPRKAFSVTGDAPNNLPEMHAPGPAYIDIGLAAIYPAGFVIIRSIQKTAESVSKV